MPAAMPESNALPHGPLSPHTAHLCVDMQNLFTKGSPWETPWMERVLPVVTRLARHRPERTVFTRFIPPARPADRPGRWRAYFERWRELTREEVDPQLLELVPPLAALVPPATVLDKPFYSPFHESGLDGLLQAREVDTLIITGTETDVCVLAAVFDAMDRGYRVILVKDALCSSADETHDALMTVYHNRFSLQVELAEAETVLAQWVA
jgi:nicotinamidase-related amidase